MAFPTYRLERAGATTEEIAWLQAQPEAQQGWIRHFEAIADGDIIEWLNTLRQTGYFKALDSAWEKIVEEVEGHDDQQDSPSEDAPEKPAKPAPK